jgi:hypothetical protein
VYKGKCVLLCMCECVCVLGRLCVCVCVFVCVSLCVCVCVCEGEYVLLCVCWRVFNIDAMKQIEIGKNENMKKLSCD